MFQNLSACGQVPQLLPAVLPNMVLLASQPASQPQLQQEPGGMVPTAAWISSYRPGARPTNAHTHVLLWLGLD